MLSGCVIYKKIDHHRINEKIRRGEVVIIASDRNIQSRLIQVFHNNVDDIFESLMQEMYFKEF